MIERGRRRDMDLAVSDILSRGGGNLHGFYMGHVVANVLFPFLVPPLLATEGPPASSRLSIRSRISRQNSRQEQEQPGRPSTAL